MYKRIDIKFKYKLEEAGPDNETGTGMPRRKQRETICTCPAWLDLQDHRSVVAGIATSLKVASAAVLRDSP